MRRTWMICSAVLCLLPGPAAAETSIRGHLETDGLPAYLRDRGAGVPTSMFGTYIQKGQWLVYPFFEFYHNREYEYAPEEYGAVGEHLFYGEYEATEELIFLSYGLTDRLAVEFEAALIQAEFEKNARDDSSLAPERSESGIGDVEGQFRYRWIEESLSRPEAFSYLEWVAPTQDEGSLIGTSAIELKLGSGVIRGFGFGTMTVRAAVEYDGADEEVAIGELALEYLRRVSSSWRLYAGVEGTQDEVELITEVQWHLAPNAMLKMNNAFGVSEKANDWAPEVGLLFSF